NEQHLAIFGGWDKMVQAETELYTNLKPGARLFFNSSDKHVREQVNSYADRNLIDSEFVKFSNVGLDPDGYLQFEIEENLLVKTKLLGAHYLPNLKHAINVAREYNISNKLIAQALTNFEPGEEFIQRKITSEGVTF